MPIAKTSNSKSTPYNKKGATDNKKTVTTTSASQPPSSLFDLDANFLFYASYHNDFMNQLVHIACVWPILFTALIMLQYTQPISNYIPSSLNVFGVEVRSLIEEQQPYEILPLIKGYDSPVHIYLNQAVFVTLLYSVFYTGLFLFNVKKLGFVGPMSVYFVVISFYWSAYLKEHYPVLNIQGLSEELFGSVPTFLGNMDDIKFSLIQVAIGIHIFCWVAQIYSHKVYEGRSPALLDNLFQALFMAPIFVLMESFFMLGWNKEYRKKVQKKVDHAVAEWKKSTKEKL